MRFILDLILRTLGYFVIWTALAYLPNFVNRFVAYLVCADFLDKLIDNEPGAVRPPPVHRPSDPCACGEQAECPICHAPLDFRLTPSLVPFHKCDCNQETPYFKYCGRPGESRGVTCNCLHPFTCTCAASAGRISHPRPAKNPGQTFHVCDWCGRTKPCITRLQKEST